MDRGECRRRAALSLAATAVSTQPYTDGILYAVPRPTAAVGTWGPIAAVRAPRHGGMLSASPWSMTDVLAEMIGRGRAASEELCFVDVRGCVWMRRVPSRVDGCAVLFVLWTCVGGVRVCGCMACAARAAQQGPPIVKAFRHRAGGMTVGSGA